MLTIEDLLSVNVVAKTRNYLSRFLLLHKIFKASRKWKTWHWTIYIYLLSALSL